MAEPDNSNASGHRLENVSKTSRIEEVSFGIVLSLLARHAGWPTPPEAWAKLFAAGVLLFEIFRPTEAGVIAQGSKSVHAGPGGRLLLMLLDRISATATDVDAFRIFFPLARMRGKLLPDAFDAARDSIRIDPIVSERHPKGTVLLNRLGHDISTHEIRGLTAHLHGDETDPDDNAPEIEDLRSEIEILANDLSEELPRIGRHGLGREVFIPFFAAVINLREAAHHLGGDVRKKDADLRDDIVRSEMLAVVEALDTQDFEDMMAGADPAPGRAQLLILIGDLYLGHPEIEAAIDELREAARDDIKGNPLLRTSPFQDPESAFRLLTEVTRPRSWRR
jgi:hypothetical protein